MSKSIVIQMPANVKLTLETLHQSQYEAYIVGGCVRDCIMGTAPKDWDITTSATPQEVKKIFPKTFDTGARFGTVTVMQGKEGLEVTTYRYESDYSDGRHPDRVTFTNHLEEDLSRRDFTINAMAYNEEKGLIDLFGGIKDIQCKQIRGVGDPCERFREDALRMLRAIRFSARLGFSIETDTYNAILHNAANIQKISMERIRDEFCKTVLTENTDRLILLKESGLLSFFLPQLTELNFTAIHLQKFPQDLVMRLAYLFAGGSFCSDKELCNCLKGFRLDNKSVQMIQMLIAHAKQFSAPTQWDRIAIKRLIAKIGEKSFCYLCEYMTYDGQDGHTPLRLFDEIKKNKECITIKDLAVNGNDLLAIGIRGSNIGVLLQKLVDEVYHDEGKNNKDALIQIVNEYK